jgi:sulfur carrier protein
MTNDKMDIVLNHNKEHIETNRMTVSELLSHKNFTFKMLIVRINNRLIAKEEYGVAEIRDGDEVMVLHLISGG